MHLRQRAGRFDGAVAHQRALVEQRLGNLLDEERIALRTLSDHPLERRQFDAVPEQSAKHPLRALAPQRVEPELRVMAATAPLMAVLGAVVDQEQDAGVCDRVGEQIKQKLSFRIDPVQVLEDQDQRLVEAFAQQDAFERIMRAPPPNLRVHLSQWIFGFLDSKQRKDVRQRVFQRMIQFQYLSDDFLAPLPRIILGNDSQVVAQKFDYRQICRGLAMGDRVGLQHQASRLRDRLELEEQARLAYPRIADRRDDLTMATAGCSNSACRPTNFVSPRRAAACSRVRNGPSPVTSKSSTGR